MNGTTWDVTLAWELWIGKDAHTVRTLLNVHCIASIEAMDSEEVQVGSAWIVVLVLPTVIRIPGPTNPLIAPRLTDGAFLSSQRSFRGLLYRRSCESCTDGFVPTQPTSLLVIGRRCSRRCGSGANASFEIMRDLQRR